MINTLQPLASLRDQIYAPVTMQLGCSCQKKALPKLPPTTAIRNFFELPSGYARPTVNVNPLASAAAEAPVTRRSSRRNITSHNGLLAVGQFRGRAHGDGLACFHGGKNLCLSRICCIICFVANVKYVSGMTITAQIRDDLKFRMQAGGDLPVPLTLESIAKMYGVSFTPVRTAVAELIEDGLLRKGGNRRLILQAPLKLDRRRKRKLPPSLPRRRDLSKEIANDLIKLSFKGQPVYLREEAMAEKYEISRSAIRNILHQFAGSGMLDHIPRRGWQLRPFRQEDMQSFLEVREVLELKASS